MKFKVMNLALAIGERHGSLREALSARTSDDKVAFGHYASSNGGQLILDVKSEEEWEQQASHPLFNNMMALGFYTISSHAWELVIEAVTAEGHVHHATSLEERLLGRLLSVSYLVLDESDQPEAGQVFWQLRLVGSEQEVYPVPTSDGERGFVMFPSGKVLSTFMGPRDYPNVIADLLRMERQDNIEAQRVTSEAMGSFLSFLTHHGHHHED